MAAIETIKVLMIEHAVAVARNHSRDQGNEDDNFFESPDGQKAHFGSPSRTPLGGIGWDGKVE
jgi:hypothetical protein